MPWPDIRGPGDPTDAAAAAVLQNVQRYVAAVNGAAIICMWDTLLPGQTGHGDGRVNNHTEMALAWGEINRVFAAVPAVKFELFNEPFGYKTDDRGARAYLAEMAGIIASAGLAEARVILDGMGYADDVRALNRAGWDGAMAYHFYPNWVPSGSETSAAYAARVLQDINGLGSRVRAAAVHCNRAL